MTSSRYSAYDVRGAEQLADLAKRLKQAGDKDLKRELMAALTRATEHLRTVDLPASARATLPKKGGLNERVAKAKFRSQKRLVGARPGLRVIAENKNLQLRLMDQGAFRHPVFGHKERKWVAQEVKPGWFTNAVEAAAPAVRAEAIKAIEAVAAKIEGTTK